MAINYPTSLDNLTNPVSTDTTTAVDHALQHSNTNDAIEALEAKVGIDGSAVTTSHDYKLSGVTGNKKALADRNTSGTGILYMEPSTPITSSTLVQTESSDGTASDWGIRVASNGYGAFSFLGSGGTLGSPTASGTNDTLGEIDFYGYNSSNTKRLIASIAASIPTVTASSEEGKLLFNIYKSGTFGSAFSITQKGFGYTTGNGAAVTQITSRTTGVTNNSPTGSITLVSAAGSTSWQTFTVTNSSVVATDTIIVNQKSGTDKYMLHVTAVGTGSFAITFATTGGTTTEQPVFNFAVIKAVAS